MSPPTLAHLPPVEQAAAWEALVAELFATINAAMLARPRNRQVLPGPSELGNPCDRALFYKLANVSACNPIAERPKWKAEIGTAVHAWLDDVFTLANTPGRSRWLCETRLSVGDVTHHDIQGSCDLYDRATHTVLDWKTTSVNKIKAYRRNGPGDQYRTQAHLYGRGWTRRGMPVDTVMIVFLPRDGELSQAHAWHEPYDETVAVQALTRTTNLANAATSLGPAGAAYMATADAYCTSCPWFRPDSTDLATGCPGHAGRETRPDPITQLIA